MHTNRLRYRQTYSQGDRHTVRNAGIDRQTETYTDSQKNRQTDKQESRQADRKTDGWTGGRTEL